MFLTISKSQDLGEGVLRGRRICREKGLFQVHLDVGGLSVVTQLSPPMNCLVIAVREV